MELLLTRRQTLQSLAFAAVGGVSFLSLAGCGGGGGDNKGGGSAPVRTTTIRVPVELPAGLSIPTSELEVGTGFGKGTIVDGAFQAKVNAAAPTFAYVRHKATGKLVLYGMVGAGRPGLTPLASAAAAMALLLGLTGLPGENVAQGLALLEANADVKALGQTIAAALKTDPYALTSGEATVTAAIKSTLAAVGGSAKMASQTANGGGRGRAESDVVVQVLPDSAQSGAAVKNNDDGTITPENQWRRPCAAYTYRVGHTPGSGAADQSAAKRIDAQDLMPTPTLLGAVVSLGQRPAFSSVLGKFVELSTEGDDEKTHYETVILMPSGDNEEGDPAFFNEARYAGEVAEWRKKREELNAYAALAGICGDVFRASALTGATLASFATVRNILASIEAAGTTASSLILDRARAGGLGYVAQEYMKAVVAEAPGLSSSRFWTAISARLIGLAEAEEAAAIGASTGAAIGAVATAFLGLLAAVGSIAAIRDLSAGYHDVVFSAHGARWQETALKPGVRINPRKADVRKGQNFALSAAVVGAAGTSAKYTWTLEGSDLANLSAGGKVGRTIETDSPSCNVQTTPSTQGVLKVTVEAKSASGKSYGRDTATLTVVENTPVVIPGTLTSKTFSFPEGESTRTLYSVGVGFSPVSGATSYSLDGTGGNDTLYYGTHIQQSSRAPVVAAPGEPTEIQNCFGLTGGSSPGDGADSVAFAKSRFNGFVFKITAYFD